MLSILRSGASHGLAWAAPTLAFPHLSPAPTLRLRTSVSATIYSALVDILQSSQRKNHFIKFIY